jgi:hypothetical protein
VLREREAGVPTAEVCRKHGVSSATFYKRMAAPSASCFVIRSEQSASAYPA